MKFLDLFRKKSVTDAKKNTSNTDQPRLDHSVMEHLEPMKPDWEGEEISDTEREEVALIASAIAAGAYPDSKFRIHKITPVDTDYEAAGVICAAIAAGDCPDSAFRIKSIKRVS